MQFTAIKLKYIKRDGCTLRDLFKTMELHKRYYINTGDGALAPLQTPLPDLLQDVAYQ